MFNLLILNMLILIIIITMLLLNFLIMKKVSKNQEKNSPFECGFDNMSNSRLPFSLQFFMISVIFLIFDIEIALILPIIKFMNFNYKLLTMNSMMIMAILLIGLLIEWKEGAFQWFK